MDAGLLAQYAVIALAVAFSASYVVLRQFPSPLRRLRVACALPLLRDGRPSWLQRVGRRIAPAPRARQGGCGTGCSGCDPS